MNTINSKTKIVVIIVASLMIVGLVVGILIINKSNNTAPEESSASGQFDNLINQDSGKQTYHSESFPQLTNEGDIVYEYNASNSFIPIMMWGPDSGELDVINWTQSNLNSDLSRNIYPEANTEGFTGVGGWVYTQWNDTNAILNSIDDNDLKVFIEVKFAIYNSITNNDWTMLSDAVNSVKDYPAVIGYYLFDETPVVNGLELTDNQIEQAANVIAATDPGKPIFVNYYKGQSPLPGFNANNTAVMDFYTVIHKETDMVNFWNGIENFYSHSNFDVNTVPFIPIIQAYEENIEERTTNAVFPTERQLRSQVFLSFIRGASGYWIFAPNVPWHNGEKGRVNYNEYCSRLSGFGPTVTPELYQQIITLNTDVYNNQKILLSKTSPIEYHLYSNKRTIENENGIKTILKSSNNDNRVYLLAGSILNEEYDLTVNFPGKNITSVKSLFDNRIIVNDPAGSNTYFTETFSNLKSALYEITFLGYVCTPICSGLTCGSDSCGGSCGSCTTGSSCNQGICSPTENPSVISVADYDSDGKINITDYNIFIADYLNWKNNEVLVSRSDFNSDGEINITDYNFFIAEYLNYKNR